MIMHFISCSALQSVTIGDSVTSIGIGAFAVEDCSAFAVRDYT